MSCCWHLGIFNVLKERTYNLYSVLGFQKSCPLSSLYSEIYIKLQCMSKARNWLLLQFNTPLLLWGNELRLLAVPTTMCHTPGMNSIGTIFQIMGCYFYQKGVLLIVWEIHTITFQSSQIYAPYPCAFPLPTKYKENIKEEVHPVQLVLPISSSEHGQLPGAKLLEITESPSHPTTRSINCEELHFSILITIYKGSLRLLPV